MQTLIFMRAKILKKLAEVKSAKASKNLEPKAKPEEKLLKLRLLLKTALKLPMQTLI